MYQGGVGGSALQQWQNSVDAIRGQVDVLIRQNDELTRQYNQDKVQEKDLIKLIEEQRQKIDALNAFLKQRAGKSDQDLRLDVLNDQLNLKRLLLNKTLLDYKTEHAKAEQVEKQLQEKRLKVSEYELHQGENAAKQAMPAAEDPELVALRKDLAAQTQAEAALMQQTNGSGYSGSSAEIDQLRNKLTALQSQKEALSGKPLATAPADKSKYYLMHAKKEELEVKIRAFEKRIEVLKSSSSLDSSWSAGRKEMVHAIVQGDARNKKLVNEIKELKENITLLKTQIGVLEKRVLFSNKK